MSGWYNRIRYESVLPPPPLSPSFPYEGGIGKVEMKLNFGTDMLNK